MCDRLLRFLVATATSAGVTEKLSFQLLEALLYRVDLNIFTGRIGGALAILQVTTDYCPTGSGGDLHRPASSTPLPTPLGSRFCAFPQRGRVSQGVPYP